MSLQEIMYRGSLVSTGTAQQVEFKAGCDQFVLRNLTTLAAGAGIIETVPVLDCPGVHLVPQRLRDFVLVHVKRADLQAVRPGVGVLPAVGASRDQRHAGGGSRLRRRRRCRRVLAQCHGSLENRPPGVGSKPATPSDSCIHDHASFPQGSSLSADRFSFPTCFVARSLSR